MANAEKLKAVLKVVKEVDRLRKNPRSRKFKGLFWDQRDWIQPVDKNGTPTEEACGTAMCFAGWTMYLEGYTEPVVGGTELKNPETGEIVDSALISSDAAEVLELTQWQADVLFEAGNKIPDLENMIRQWTRPTYVAKEYEDEEW
jgi:hypothetical protein